MMKDMMFADPMRGIRVYETDDLPEESHEYSAIWAAHPIIRFLSRYLEISPWATRSAEEVVPASKAYRVGRDLIVSRSMMHAIKNDPRIINIDYVA